MQDEPAVSDRRKAELRTVLKPKHRGEVVPTDLEMTQQHQMSEQERAKLREQLRKQHAEAHRSRQ